MSFRSMGLLMLVLAGFCSSQRGVAADPPRKQLQELQKVTAKIYETIRAETLENGLRIYLLPIRDCPVVTTMMAYKVGSADEELDQTGLSHYLEHLMFKGTEKKLPGDIDRLTQRNGGRNNAYTSEDMTVYHFDFAADRWMTALEIEADRMRNLKIDEKHEFEQEKGAVIAELAGNEDTAWDLEGKMILPLLYGEKSPYGHPVIGEKEHVKAATAEVIKAHYDKWYHPNNASLIVVGGFDEAAALAKIKQLFGAIPKTELPARKVLPAPPQRKEAVRKKISSKFETPRLLMGFNGVNYADVDAYPLDVLQYLLTNGKTSRLHQRLITEEQIAATITAVNSTGRYPGWFQIQIESMDHDDLKKCEERVLSEIAKIAKDGVPEPELNRVLRGIVSQDIFQHESPHDLADMIARTVVLEDLDYLKNWTPKMLLVTSKDLQRVATKYFADRKGISIYSIPGDDDAAKEKQNTRLDPKMQKHPSQKEASRGAEGFSLKDAKVVTLPNKLRLLLLENHRLPVVHAQAYVKNVRLFETEKTAGIAELLGDLLSEGTATKTARQISEQIEEVGGTLTLSSSGGSVKTLSTDMETGITLLLECLIKSDFPAKELEIKRELLLSSIEETESNPRSKAENLFDALIYGKHPFGRSSLGNAKVVEKLTREQLRKFHSSVFVPNNTILAIVGDFDSKKLTEQITKLTLDWKEGELPKIPEIPVKLGKKSQQKIISDPNAAQLHIYLGHVGIRRDSEDYFRLLVMDNILGTSTGFTDRLSSNLRDRQGLAYTVTAGITASAGKEPGTFAGYIGTYPDKFEVVKEGFLKEIERLRKEAPTAEEVDDVKRFLIGSFPFRLTSSSSVAGQLLILDEYNLGMDYPEKYRKAIDAVTAEEVRSMAEKYIHPDKLVIVAVGPVDPKGKPLPEEKK